MAKSNKRAQKTNHSDVTAQFMCVVCVHFKVAHKYIYFPSRIVFVCFETHQVNPPKLSSTSVKSSKPGY